MFRRLPYFLHVVLDFFKLCSLLYWPCISPHRNPFELIVFQQHKKTITEAHRREVTPELSHSRTASNALVTTQEPRRSPRQHTSRPRLSWANQMSPCSKVHFMLPALALITVFVHPEHHRRTWGAMLGCGGARDRSMEYKNMDIEPPRCVYRIFSSVMLCDNVYICFARGTDISPSPLIRSSIGVCYTFCTVMWFGFYSCSLPPCVATAAQQFQDWSHFSSDLYPSHLQLLTSR